MSFEEEFDGIIRRKAEEAHVPFNEADWLKASAMLDAGRKPAAWSWYYYAAAALVVTIGITWLYISTSNQSTTTADKNETNVVAAAPAENLTSLSTNANGNDITNKNGLEIPANATEVAALPLPAQNSTIENKLGKDRLEHKHLSSPIPMHQAQEISMDQSRSSNTASEQSPVEESNSSNPQSEQNTQPIANDAKVQHEKQPMLNSTGIGNDGEKINDDPSQTLQTTSIASSPAEPRLTPSVNNQEIVTEEATLTENWQYLNTQLAPLQTEQELKVSISPLKQPTPEDYAKVKVKKHYLRGMLGAIASNGSQNGQQTEGKFISPIVGMNYGMYVTKRVSLNVGLSAWEIKNLESAWYKVTAVNYNYFYTTNSVAVATQSMKMLSLPVGLSWHPKRRHQITAGVQLNRIIDAKNTFIYEGPLETTNANRTEQKQGIFDGMKLNTWAAHFNYRYECRHRLSMVLGAHIQMQPYFEGNILNLTHANPIYVNAGLSYTLFDK